MNTGRKTTILAGALYFLGITAGVFSVVPIIDIPNYLAQISVNAGQVNSGWTIYYFHWNFNFNIKLAINSTHADPCNTWISLPNKSRGKIYA